MKDLIGQTAIVTGGAQGIGLGIALELARAGSNVVIADRNLQLAVAACAEIQERAGVEAIASAVDVRDSEAIQNCIDTSIGRFSRVEILVNNAGIHCEKLNKISTIDEFQKCFDVNLFGVWRMSQALVPHFRAQGGGKIVNIASIDGRVPWADTPAYSASKAAVINLTQSLATTLAPLNINVNAICPGGIMTAMADMFARGDKDAFKRDLANARLLKRQLLPEDIGHAVVFFSSIRSSNITGQALNVDGGQVMN